MYASCSSVGESRGGKVNAPASSDEVGLKRRGSIWLRCIFYMEVLDSIDGDGLIRTDTGSRSSEMAPKDRS